MSESNILSIADCLVKSLAQGCERIEIAGSIRRGKAHPKDIEIVAIPRLIEIPRHDIFGQLLEVYLASALDTEVDGLIGDDWRLDPEVRRNGSKYKRLQHTHERNYEGRLIALDLFITSPAAWGAIFTIRTGPGDFSQALVSRALELGCHIHKGQLHQHRKNSGQPCEKGEACPLILPTPEEADFFKALKVRYLAPAERTLENFSKAKLAR